MNGNIGFIGMGNMARAIAQGILSAGAEKAENLYAYAPHWDRLAAFTCPLGMHACATTEEVISACDVIVMAVKPYIVEGVLAQYREDLKGKAILSVVAGYTHQKYRALVDESTRVQYIMPNTPCAVGAGMLLFEEENSLTEEELSCAKAIFAALGEVEVLPTRLMDIGMVLSGCGPAFAAMMIEAMGDAGVKYGLPRATAYKLASQMMVGTGKLQLSEGLHPGVLKDGVCSPGGTTIRGVEALEHAGLRSAMLHAVAAIMDR